MPVKWQSAGYPGVRFYEHPARKHGVRPDRYFAIRYQHQGKRREEGLGWGTEGWTASKAAAERARLKASAQTGEGPISLEEKREEADAKRQAVREEAERARNESITFGHHWRESYFPQAKEDKTPRTWKREQSFFKCWMGPVLDHLPLRAIAPLHIERIKKNMAQAGRAPRSICYCLDVVRQVFNHAGRLGVFDGESPTSKVKKPKFDNRRLRFLSPDEAGEVLRALASNSLDLHDIALLSLHCGLRAGEIFSLAWGDVDLQNELLTLRDTKSGRTRTAYLTETAMQMLARRVRGGPSDLIFPARGGGQRQQVSKAFSKVVNKLGLNDGVTDPRYKVTFHTIRHTYASWLVMEGTPLVTVQRLLGHRTIAMTERYSHLAPDHMRQAVQQLERKAEEAGQFSHLDAGSQVHGN